MIDCFRFLCAVLSNLNGYSCHKFINFKRLCHVIVCPRKEQIHIAKSDNIALKDLLDMWAEEELKVGTLSNGTVENYLGAIRCIKKYPLRWYET